MTRHLSPPSIVAALLFGALLALASPVAALDPTRVPQAAPAGAQPEARALRWVTLKEAAAAPAGTQVLVRARLGFLQRPQEGTRQPYTLYVFDKSGVLRVVVWPDQWERFAERGELRAGITLDAYGPREVFRNLPQIVIKDPTHLRISPVDQSGGVPTMEEMKVVEELVKASGAPPSAPESTIGGAVPGAGSAASGSVVPISSLRADADGQPVRLQGTVQKVVASNGPSVPWRIQLKDTTGETTVVYWPEVAETMSSEIHPPKAGQQFRVDGVINPWKNQIQVKVSDAAGLQPLAVGNAAAPTVAPVESEGGN